MASIKKYFKVTSTKRQREPSTGSDKSSTSKSPPTKKVEEESKPIDYLSDSPFIKYLEKMDSSLGYITEHFNEDENTPIWAKHMYAKLCDLTIIHDETKVKLNSVITNANMLEEKLDEVNNLAKESSKMIASLTMKVDSLTTENQTLLKRVNELEDYSKKYNIKLFNVEETPGEDTHILKAKFSDILAMMDINSQNIYIDNIHRLPHGGKGPRPIIVKFVSALDKILVWNRRSKLSQTNLVLREHFCKSTEDNIRILLPIRRAAIDNNMKVKMTGDKLYINNSKFEVTNLNTLPNVLQEARFGSKTIDDKLFFFSSISPLSNFHPSPFMVDGNQFTCGEQFIQWSKATLFKNTDIATEILSASHPAHMKKLGSKVQSFSPSVWKDSLPEIAKLCIASKFEQNSNLRNYLLKTENKKLYEASPYDSVWGIGYGIHDSEILKKQSKWGLNLLGNTLQDVRRQLTTT